MPYSLTRDQADCARVIAELTEVLGRAPTIDEIAAEMDLASRTNVYTYLRALAERGWLASDRPIVLHGGPPPPPPETGIELTPAGEAWLRAAPGGALA